MLVAPLDWGLGHTTRCVPLIRHLRASGISALFAGTETQCTFVRSLFPDLECLPLGGYGITYAKTGRGFLPKLLAQVPRLLRTIHGEHRWLLDLAVRRPIDGVLSDNRYGLWHPRIPSVILTHQLCVQTGLGHSADTAFQTLHYRLLNRFGACWAVDVENAPGLSGLLAHPSRLPHNTQYTGLLSQFETPSAPATKRHLLVLLSGPEPQRTMLSDLLWPQALALGVPVVFVEGTKSAPARSGSLTVRWMPRTGGQPLQRLLEEASYVVCRSGYSTLMDAARLGLRLIAIPTPGQTEQELLARTLHASRQVLHRPQRGFSLQEALTAAQQFLYAPWPPGDDVAYKAVLDAWLARL